MRLRGQIIILILGTMLIEAASGQDDPAPSRLSGLLGDEPDAGFELALAERARYRLEDADPRPVVDGVAAHRPRVRARDEHGSADPPKNADDRPRTEKCRCDGLTQSVSLLRLERNSTSSR